MRYQVKERNTGEVIAIGFERQQVQVFEGNLYFAPEAVNRVRSEMGAREGKVKRKRGICQCP